MFKLFVESSIRVVGLISKVQKVCGMFLEGTVRWLTAARYKVSCSVTVTQERVNLFAAVY